VKTKLATGLLAVLLFAGRPALSAAGALLDEAVKDYQAGNYQQAVVKLARITGADPFNVTAHYYLANSLVYVKEKQEAKEEYRLCYVLDPHGPLSDYCRQALVLFKEPIPSDRDAKIMRDTIFGALKNAGLNVPASGTPISPPGAPVSASIDQTLSLIRKEEKFEKAKQQSIGDAGAQAAAVQGEQAARAVDARAEADIARLYSRPSPGVQPLTLDEIRARELSIRNSAVDEKNRILRDAQLKADRYQGVAKEKQVSLEQVADNLEKQLATPHSGKGVRLLPDGTDLYVRHYDSSSAAPDTHAAVARLYGKPVGTQTQVSSPRVNPAESADDKKLDGQKPVEADKATQDSGNTDNSQSEADKQVRGKIIK
jgi:hypothetical protein